MLDAWRRTPKSAPLHASSHLNVLLSMLLFVSADVTPHSSFPTFPSCHVPSIHVPTRTMRWLVACARTLTSVLVYAASYLRVCLFMFILLLGDLASHMPPFRRVRHSHYMRMSFGMPRFSFRPRYRTFRTPGYF
jgi:hypothetical protein